MMKIIIGSESDVKNDLDNVHVIAASYWQTEGYTVIPHKDGYAVVGKNAATGEDNPEALTTAWDTIKEHNGQFWFYSPANDSRFSEYRQRGIDAGMNWLCEEVEIPQDLLDTFDIS